VADVGPHHGRLEARPDDDGIDLTGGHLPAVRRMPCQ
jgi:hypothetical protein